MCFAVRLAADGVCAAADALAGLNQLQLLTVNVDTLQLHVASSGALTSLSTMAADTTAGGSSSGDESNKQQQQQGQESALAGAGPVPEPAAAEAVAGAPKQQLRQRQRRQQQQPSAAAAGAAAGTKQEQLAPVPQPQQQQQQQQQGQQQQQALEQRCPAQQPPPPQQQRCPPLLPLVDPAVWRGLGQLHCLRLLMLGHVHSDLLPSEGGRVRPRIAGITRLELCSAFGGKPEYAATYSIAEDPALWQEQVGCHCCC
jgi:hypothetical protein